MDTMFFAPCFIPVIWYNIRVRKRDTNMKVNLKIRKNYKGNKGLNTNVIQGMTFKQYLNLIELKEKGLIAKDFYTYDLNVYLKVIKELKEKKLIQ